MTSLSDTPPTPPSNSDALIPLPPLPPDEETTQRLEVEDAETRPFVKRDEAPATEVILRPLEGEQDPADDLGFDRPLFIPMPPPPARPVAPPAPEPLTPTEEAVDKNGYERLVAATRNERPGASRLRGPRRKQDPTPPWPAEIPPPEVLFASAEHRAIEDDEEPEFDPVEEVETFDRTAEEAETFSRGASETSGEIETSPSPELVIQPDPLPMEATQQPGTTPPSVLGLVAHRDRDRTWIVLAAVSVLFSVALGILGGVLLRLVAEPVPARQREVARSTPPPKPARPPLARQRPNLELLLKQAREAAARDDHPAAYDAFGRVLTHRPDDPAALWGFAASGVELGHEHVLFLLQRSMHQKLRRKAPVLGVRLAMVNGKWKRADRLIRALPRRARYSTRVMTWTAQIWHRLGRLESARPLYKRVLRDPRLRDRRVRAEALIGLSEVLLDRNYRTGSFKRARQAREIAARLGSPALTRRIERQIIRCRQALSR